MGQQEANQRRGAPGGKRFIGGAAEQSARARRAERQKVERMAEVASAEQRADVPEPVVVVLAELVDDAVRLGRTLVTAPFRIAQALRHPREA